MGPLISARQERRVLGYLDIGVHEGAEVVTGGHKLTGAKYDRGFFVEPTIFDRVTPDMRIAQEEIFGPVLSVLSFDSEDEAVEIANGTQVRAERVRVDVRRRAGGAAGAADTGGTGDDQRVRLPRGHRGPVGRL